jgi:probable rRNA maturation factor
MSDGDQRRSGSLRVLIATDARQTVRPRGLGSWLSGAAPAAARGEVTVALISDRRMRRLNREFRRIDRPTDVLSFPNDQDPEPTPDRRSPHRPLGEIAIATGVARRQARRAGHSLQTELRLLALHGLLHLLGYDHERDSGEMASLEVRLRQKAGLPEALIERAGRQPRSRAIGARADRTAARAPQGRRRGGSV